MRPTNSLTAALATAITTANALSQGVSFVAGNYYGLQIEALSYVGWGSPGQYNRVVDMSNGACQFENVTYSGGMAPLDGEVSLHFRGPMHLKQFAFYTPVAASTKRSHRLSKREKRHHHSHRHLQKRRPGNVVITATIDGQVVSWTTTFDQPPATTTTMALGDVVITATINGQVVSWITNFNEPQVTKTVVMTDPAITSQTPTSNANAIQSSVPTTSTSNASIPTSSSVSGWSRQAYYDADAQSADGLVFLNNHGGAGSGVFDYQFGMSLSYASSDGTTAAASPEILSTQMLDDVVEVSIWTDQKCVGNDCGYYRPGSVAYHGFNGPTKLFLIEFDMPMTTDQTILNSNMPAIWALNANIPRTQQYGSCSCWPGCGEWDLFEVLNPGNFRMSSSVESDFSGRDIDWFERPTNGTMKAAIFFDGPGSAGHIRVLPDDTDFSTSLPASFWSESGTAYNNRLVNTNAGDGSGYVAKVFSLLTHTSN